MTLLHVKVTQPPAKLPVTEQEFIDQARLNGLTVQRQPELLQRELAAATSRGEMYCRRSFITQKLAALFVSEPGEPPETARVILLPRGRVQSVESVESAGAALANTVDLEWG